MLASRFHAITIGIKKRYIFSFDCVRSDSAWSSVNGSLDC